jgi:hypothetical protein
MEKEVLIKQKHILSSSLSKRPFSGEDSAYGIKKSNSGLRALSGIMY